MLHKYGKRTLDFFGRFFFSFSLVSYILGAFLIKTVIVLALAGYEMIIANSLLCTSSAIYHLPV